MTNAALPFTPDERIKLYDWVQYTDAFYTRIGLNVPVRSRRACLVTKILLIDGAVRLELCFDPRLAEPAEYCWVCSNDIELVQHG